MSKKKDRDGVYTRKDRSGFTVGYYDATGKRRLKKIHAKTLAEAKQMRSAFIARVEKQKVLGVAEADDTAFASVADRYLKYEKPRIEDQTYRRYEDIVEQHLKPAFNGKIGAITRAKVSDFVTDRLNEAAPATVQKEFNVLKHILRLAHEEWNLIPDNPAKALTVKSLAIKLPPGRIRYLHPDELLTLLEECPVWLRPIVILGIATGLRRGNIVNLYWSQYYEHARQLMIRKTKNGEMLVVHLNEIGLLSLALAEHHFGRSKSGRIFPGVTPNQATMAFRRACASAKIEDFRFHDLRHTNASWLRMSGADIHTVAAVLGHKDIRMTVRYSHLSGDFLAGQVRQLDGVFSSLLQLKPAPDSAVREGDCFPIATGALDENESVG